MSSPAYLAICAACGAHPAASIWATEVPQPAPYHCPRCRPGLMTGAEQLADSDARTRLRFVDGWEGARWYVIEIQEDGFFLVGYVGLPGIPPRRRHVNEIQPAFSYAKIERERARRA